MTVTPSVGLIGSRAIWRGNMDARLSKSRNMPHTAQAKQPEAGLIAGFHKASRCRQTLP